jgi:signal transduction histidine kinase/ActR/RegA family two-component response regulator
MKPEKSAQFELYPGGDEMAQRMRATDWASTSLGPVETWPDNLRLILATCFDSQFGMAVWWGPEMIQFYNDAYRPMLGSSKHPAAFGGPARATWPEIWSTIGPMAEQVMRKGEAVKGQDMPLMMDRNGYLEKCFFTFSYSPVRNLAGVVEGMFITSVETTARVHAERRVQLQLDLADRLHGMTSVTGIIEAACELLGMYLDVSRVYYSEIDDADMIFRVPAKWFSSPAVPPLPSACGIAAFGPALNEAIRRSDPFVIDDVRIDARTEGNAAAFTVIAIESIMMVPIRKTGSVSTHINITTDRPRAWTQDEIWLAGDVAQRTFDAIERARAEAAFHAELENTRRAEAALRTADVRKNEFLAMLAHELRNPLAPISAAADLLSLTRLDEHRIKSTSKIISRQVQHMTSLVDDLLDVSRVTTGLTKIDKAPLDLAGVVGSAVEQVRPLFETRGHTLDIVQGAEAALVDGDHKRLVQVLSNLLNNAAKYTPENGRITLEVEVLAEQVLMRVSDNGIGMTAELVERAFDLFAQAERTPDRSQGGLGLGLALVRSMVELHGGTVTAHSAGLGCGSRFQINLPRLSWPACAPLERADGAQRVVNEGALRVLVVDDNTDAADMLAMLVEASGHRAGVEHHPLQALERARVLRPEACLLDIGLPGMDGYELAQPARQIPGLAQTLLIAVTGYGRPEDREDARAAGFDHHFVKPVDTARLVDLLANAPRLGAAMPT